MSKAPDWFRRIYTQFVVAPRRAGPLIDEAKLLERSLTPNELAELGGEPVEIRVCPCEPMPDRTFYLPLLRALFPRRVARRAPRPVRPGGWQNKMRKRRLQAAKGKAMKRIDSFEPTDEQIHEFNARKESSPAVSPCIACGEPATRVVLIPTEPVDGTRGYERGPALCEPCHEVFLEANGYGETAYAAGLTLAYDLAPTPGVAPAEWSELHIVAATVFGEARGEDFMVKFCVACVIANRARRGGWWGSTPKAVCLKKYQFSCWLEGDPNRRKLDAPLSFGTFETWLECLAAANFALNFAGDKPLEFAAARKVGGTLASICLGATHYHDATIEPPAWTKEMTRIGSAGSLTFYQGS